MDAKNENITAPRKSSFVLIVNIVSALIFQNFSIVTPETKRANQYADQPFLKKDSLWCRDPELNWGHGDFQSRIAAPET